MPNNADMTDSEIIQLLGGATAIARMLDIKPPSVQGWLETGIPEGRLRDLAAQIEIRSAGKFSRRKRWPDKFAFYWPELAQPQSPTATPAVSAHEPKRLDIRAPEPRRQQPLLDRCTAADPANLGRRKDAADHAAGQGV